MVENKQTYAHTHAVFVLNLFLVFRCNQHVRDPISNIHGDKTKHDCVWWCIPLMQIHIMTHCRITQWILEKHTTADLHTCTHTHSEGLCGLGWLIGVFSSGDSCTPQRQHTVSRSTLTSAGHTHTHSQTSSLPFSAEMRPPLPPSARFHLADSNSVLPRSNWLRYDAGEHSGECVLAWECVCVFLPLSCRQINEPARKTIEMHKQILTSALYPERSHLSCRWRWLTFTHTHTTAAKPGQGFLPHEFYVPLNQP